MTETIIQLLQRWQAFTLSGGSNDFFEFGQWLQREQRPDSQPRLDENQFPIESLLGYYLGNLMGYTEVWSKMSFENLPIKSLTDFGILKYIERVGGPAKQEVARISLAENSTVFESMKRLKRIELIQEFPDEIDRRVKHVKLTPKGTEITRQATDQSNKLANLLVGNLSAEEKKQLLEILKKLQDFHHRLYQEKDRTHVRQIFNS